MITINDVAKHAKVSKMTVSRVINHPEQVTEDLRERVIFSMAELNYRPNYAARAIASSKTGIIQFIVKEKIDTTDPYFIHLLAGISEGLSEKYYSLLMLTQDSNYRGRCDGIIYTGMNSEDLQALDLDTPCIIFGENQEGYDFIDVDNEAGTKLSTMYFIEQGYQNIAMFTMDWNVRFAQQRKNGYIQAMADHNLKTKIFDIQNDTEIAKKEAFAVLQNHTFEAVICGSDAIAVGVTRAARKLGIKIPEELAVIGFDGVFLDQIANPKITTVKQPIHEMGRSLASELIETIESKRTTVVHRYFQPQLVVRETTKKS
ncbi:MAG: LacI family DNA-binding transcriptional regulator [Culicoidibacterales bacterium]